ncbi:globin domain-containing protein [Streptomyces carminius]|nr:globin domain-containing protein [Streptomyces carminius]
MATTSADNGIPQSAAGGPPAAGRGGDGDGGGEWGWFAPAGGERTAEQSARPGPDVGSAGSAGSAESAESAEPAYPANPGYGRFEPSRDAELIRRTLEEIEPISQAVTSYFYALLFLQHPGLRELFPASMDSQRDRLFKALLTAAKLVDERRVLVEFLSHLGRGHRKYGTRPEHYPAVGECLIAALTRYATRTWSAETEAAWVRAYTAISQIMIDAAAEDERRAPAWWRAEVVAHELRTPDIAVLTLRPDQPYPFRAGQYTSIETPWWPKVWRHYSLACAPRPDGLLVLHVKVVPAGWVSTALVHRARPGDVLRLGAAAGSMAVDHSSDAGLLCLGGGTGIAPVKALVEEVARGGRARSVEVFYGARAGRDLYDLEAMRELDRRYPWLTVRPVAAEGPPDGGGLTGRLPDVVREHGPWQGYDGYLSGPPGMVRSGVEALVAAGVPAHRIRHDSLDALGAAGASRD